MNRLQSFFSKYPSCALAFSGGTDSALLLAAAAKYGTKTKAYFIKTAFQPTFEQQDALLLAERLGVPFEILPMDIFRFPEVCQNTPERCYYCKRALFSHILSHAKADGFSVIIDGTNASDRWDDRPGMRAVRELAVLSPLQECGITKKEVRQLSEELGLFTWNKPSYSCLATRIPHGTALTPELLRKTEAGENLLFSLGFSDFRLRYDGKHLTLELTPEQFPLFWRTSEEVCEELTYLFPGTALYTKGRDPSL